MDISYLLSHSALLDCSYARGQELRHVNYAGPGPACLTPFSDSEDLITVTVVTCYDIDLDSRASRICFQMNQCNEIWNILSWDCQRQATRLFERLAARFRSSAFLVRLMECVTCKALFIYNQPPISIS
jgi:hypothetical protein